VTRLTIAEVEAIAPTAPTMLELQHPEYGEMSLGFDYEMGALVAGLLHRDGYLQPDLRWHFSVGIWVFFSAYVVPPSGAQEEWRREWMQRHPRCAPDCLRYDCREPEIECRFDASKIIYTGPIIGDV
jgi:hypothetical protein